MESDEKKIQDALNDLNSGRAKLIPHDEVMARTEARLKAYGIILSPKLGSDF